MNGKKKPVELHFKEVKRLRSVRAMHPKKCYQDEYQGVCTDTNYYSVLNDDNDEDERNENNEYEILNVGVGIDGGHKHSSDLKVLNYK